MSKMRMSAVSLRADKSYIRALRSVADDQDTLVGDMVRAALDNAYGPEIERYRSFFARAEQRHEHPRKALLTEQ